LHYINALIIIISIIVVVVAKVTANETRGAVRRHITPQSTPVGEVLADLSGKSRT